MASSVTEAVFIVWGIDQIAYGPVELPTLVSWVKDERVTADTWVYAGKSGAWQKASSVPELQMFFRSKSGADSNKSAHAVNGIDIRALRRVKILANMNDDQLEKFCQFMVVEDVPQFGVIVKQGDRGDTMYLILQGELRVRINTGGSETVLATLSVGEFFGDISLFDQGPRSADVVANTDSVLVKITAEAFQEFAKASPEMATPFLLSVGKTLTARIRADNKRYGDSVRFARAAQ
jgi:cAMP-binding proteins - catabolite gene activator and regulatory subunit of cAMP-dependent protein kinases